MSDSTTNTVRNRNNVKLYFSRTTACNTIKNRLIQYKVLLFIDISISVKRIQSDTEILAKMKKALKRDANTARWL